MGSGEAGTSRPSAVIPFRIRVGVTGHRTLEPDQTEAVTAAMADVLHAIRGLIPGSDRTPVALSMISPLAEGADRIAAHAALAMPGTQLEAPIPFDAREYEMDFEVDKPVDAAAASKDEFRALLDAATSSLVLGTRTDGYRPVGWYVVDRADVLVAVWDGEGSRGKGGTAEIVHRAVENNVPVVWIPLSQPDEWGAYAPAPVDSAPVSAPSRMDARAIRELTAELGRDFERIDHYNATVLARAAHADGETGVAVDRDIEGDSDTWVSDAARAADSLATHYQVSYRGLMRWTFILAVLAATAITAQTAFAGEWIIDPFQPGSSTEVRVPWLGLVEVVSLVALLVVVVQSHRSDAHRCYLEYRFLAERLRATPYLAMVGADARDVRPSILNADFAVYRSEGWPWRAFDEIWARRTPKQLDDTNVTDLRDAIAERWIRDERMESPKRTTGRQGEVEYCRAVRALGEQTGPEDHSQFGYHQRTYCRERRLQRRLGFWVTGLFVVTGISALVHLGLEIAHHQAETDGFTLPHAAVFLSITVAAAGAALSGYLAQRGHRQQATRSLRMLTYLAIDNERVRTAQTTEALRHRVEDTHRHILAENRLWFEGLSYEEVELHT